MRISIIPLVFCLSCVSSCTKESSSLSEPDPEPNLDQVKLIEPLETKGGTEVTDATEEKVPEDSFLASEKSSGNDSAQSLPFGISKELFEAQPRRFQSQIIGMESLPERVPEEWFQANSGFVQTNILRGDFVWGKSHGKVVLGVRNEDGEFLTWPESRILEMEEKPSIAKSFFGYPLMPNTFGDVPLRKSF